MVRETCVVEIIFSREKFSVERTIPGRANSICEMRRGRDVLEE